MRACISPRLQVQIKGPTGLWQELGRTDVVQNNLNPEFKKKVELDYTFEKKQELKFIVYDWLTPPPRAPHSRPHSAAVCGTCGQVARACGMLALVRGARQRSMHKTSCLCRLPPRAPPPPLPATAPRDGKSQNLDAHDFLGTCETSMGAIVGGRGSTLITALTGTAGTDAKRCASACMAASVPWLCPPVRAKAPARARTLSRVHV
jgi:hypothetical protein